MSFSKGKLKSNGIKSRSCLKALLLGHMSYKCLPDWTLLSVSFKRTFISLINCKGFNGNGTIQDKKKELRWKNL